jgi:zinc protease
MSKPSKPSQTPPNKINMTTPKSSNKPSALIGPDSVIRHVLPNGIILIYEDFSTQSVVFSGSLDVCARLDPADKIGLADFTAAALMRGTAQHNFDSLYETLEGMAARLSVSGGIHNTGFSGKSLAEDFPTLISLLAEALQTPTFPTDQVERLFGEARTGLKMALKSTGAVARDLFDAMLYPPGHPLALGMKDELAALDNLSRDDLVAFHASNYGILGMSFVVVGAIEAQAAIDCITAHFAGWHNPLQPAMPALPDVYPPTQTRRDQQNLRGKTQSDLVIGWLGPSRYADDYQAANIANNILGAFGMMGRLGTAVREHEGLAYYARSSMAGGPVRSPWVAVAGINPSNVSLTSDLILAEVRRLCTEPVSAQELDDNKANFIGRVPLGLESNEGVAATLSNIERYGLGLDYIQRYKSMISSISIEDVQAAAQRYLNADCFVQAVAGPDLT